MMRKVKLCMDSCEYRVKPTGAEIGRISNRIARSDREITLSGIDDFKEFAEKVGERGITFSPATYHNESRSTKNFAQMQLIVLDFDKGISHEDVIDRTREYDLPVIIAYETLSSIGQNKFRVIFQNSTSITNVRLAKIILNALYTRSGSALQ